jgi:3-oxoacyl-[acyl-carrier protein] reductase
VTRGVALVTGARGGLGQALIRRLRQAEYDVIAHSRGAVLDTDTDVRWLDGDLSDLLVNNAADQSLGALDVLTAEDWAAMIGATLMSAVNLAQAAHATMGSGASIINISSVEATSPFPRHAHYAAAKAALESFTRSAAMEWGAAGVRVNAVAPGLIDRPGLDRDWPEGVAWWRQTSPLGRPVTPDEVADAVLFLAEASGVSGVVLPVDGGWSASVGLG